jgi:signal transduction histidine kinase
MPEPRVDPRWPKILSLSVHEFRTPLTVVAGYIRMLLKERAGAVTDQQRRLLEEAEKSCGRLSALLGEVSELSNLEAGTLPMNKQEADLHDALRTAVEGLPPLPDREVGVELQVSDVPAPLDADPVRLPQALASVVAALRRELVGTDPLIVREQRAMDDGTPVYDIRIGDPETLSAIDAGPEQKIVFDEWRGGVGLSLAVARRILTAHGASIWAPPEGRKGGARIVMPRRAP